MAPHWSRKSGHGDENGSRTCECKGQPAPWSQVRPDSTCLADEHLLVDLPVRLFRTCATALASPPHGGQQCPPRLAPRFHRVFRTGWYPLWTRKPLPRTRLPGMASTLRPSSSCRVSWGNTSPGMLVFPSYLVSTVKGRHTAERQIGSPACPRSTCPIPDFRNLALRWPVRQHNLHSILAKFIRPACAHGRFPVVHIRLSMNGTKPRQDQNALADYQLVSAGCAARPAKAAAKPARIETCKETLKMSVCRTAAAKAS